MLKLSTGLVRRVTAQQLHTCYSTCTTSPEFMEYLKRRIKVNFNLLFHQWYGSVINYIILSSGRNFFPEQIYTMDFGVSCSIIKFNFSLHISTLRLAIQSATGL